MVKRYLDNIRTIGIVSGLLIFSAIASGSYALYNFPEKSVAVKNYFELKEDIEKLASRKSHLSSSDVASIVQNDLRQQLLKYKDDEIFQMELEKYEEAMENSDRYALLMGLFAGAAGLNLAARIFLKK